jgi:hypothetical protein
MTNNLQEMLYGFVSNVIDCCDEAIIHKFINTSNTVNIDILINHPLTKISVIFQILWQSVFKSTVPTKKDFAELVGMLGGYSVLSNPSYVINPNVIIHACIGHDAFVILRMTTNLTEILQSAEKQIPQLTLANIHAFLVDKWVHRFRAVSPPNNNNIIRTFVQLQKQYLEAPSNTSFNLFNMSFKPITETFSTGETKWMNEHEQTQYILYRNNRMFLQLIGHYIIVCHKKQPPKYILQTIQQDVKKHVSILYVDATTDTKLGLLDHKVSKDIYEMLPKIAQNVICIDTPIDWQHPIADHTTSALYINLDEPSKYVIDTPQPKQFKMCLTNMHGYTDPLRHVYALPCETNEFNKQIMKYYITHKCPFVSSNIVDNATLYAHFLAMYMHKVHTGIENIPHSNQNDCSNVLLSIDTRFNILTLYAVLASYVRISNKSDWKMCIVTCKSAIPQYQKALCEIIGKHNVI